MERYLGEFEQLVLLALIRLEGRGYGVPVRQMIEDRTGREVSLGTVYKALQRLEAKGYVTTSIAEPTATRGGRRKKLYCVAGSGVEVLDRSLSGLRRMLHGLAMDWKLS